MSRLFAALAVSLLLSPSSWGVLQPLAAQILGLGDDPSQPATSTSDSGASWDPWGGPQG